MAVQLTAILLGHAQQFNNSCRVHTIELEREQRSLLYTG